MNSFSFFAWLRKLLVFLLVIALILVAAFAAYRLINDQPLVFEVKPEPPVLSSNTPKTEPTKNISSPPPKHVVPDLHIAKFQVGDFGPDPERLKYESGSMTLSIPRLDYEGTVLSVDLAKTTAALESEGLNVSAIDTNLMDKMNTILDEGVVLFNQAQLPGAENRNVSIAGHRDYKNMEFYYIDTITNGDLMYLYYEGKEYVYQYEKTFVTNDSDWDPIAVSDKSKLTLQSCDPIFAPNGAYDRIFVVANLIDIIDTTETVSEPETDDDEEAVDNSKKDSNKSKELIISSDNWSKDLLLTQR